LDLSLNYIIFFFLRFIQVIIYNFFFFILVLLISLIYFALNYVNVLMIHS